MTDLDRELRATMARRAERAPSANGLMGAVLERGRRQRRRRLMGGLLALVLVAGAGGVGAALLLHPEENRTLQITDGARKAWPGPAPISPGWLPDGFEKKPIRYLGPQAWGLSYRRANVPAWLLIEVMTPEPEVRAGSGKVSTVDVDGRDARLYWVPDHEPGDPTWGTEFPESLGPFAELTYEREPGQWIKVLAQNSEGGPLGLTEQDVVKIAENLNDEQQPVPDAVRMELPPGLEVGKATSGSYREDVVLVDAGTPPAPAGLDELPDTFGDGPSDARLLVSLTRSDSPDVKMLSPGATRELGSKEPLDFLEASEVPPEGKAFRQGPSLYFIHRVAGNDEAMVVLTVKTDDPLASSVEGLRAIAGSVRPGPDSLYAP